MLITSITFTIIKILTDLHLFPKGNIAIFFSRGHGNELSNLIGSLHGSDFPISAHGHGNGYVSFCPFIYKAI